MNSWRHFRRVERSQPQISVQDRHGIERKSYETALARFRAVPNESAAAGQAILMTAMSLRHLGRVDESRQQFAAALKSAGDSPLAAEILFQQAQLERTGTDRELAAQIFEDIADRWPQSEHTTECLFDAAELRLELNDTELRGTSFHAPQTGIPGRRAEASRENPVGASAPRAR